MILEQQLQQLSAGAAKLYLALQIKPDATRDDLSRLTGYKPRHLRQLRRELEALDLIRSAVEPHPARNQAAATQPNESYQLLTEQGVKPAMAKRLVAQYLPEQVRASIHYVRQEQTRTHIDNPAGLLIWHLQHAMSTSEVNPASSDRTDLTQADPETGPGQALDQSGLDRFDLAFVVTQTTGSDPRLEASVSSRIDRLYELGYRAEHVLYIYEQVWPRDWRGRNVNHKGRPKDPEPFTLAILEELIGHALAQSGYVYTTAEAIRQRLGEARDRYRKGEPIYLQDLNREPCNPMVNRYIQDPYFRRHELADEA